jgi:copper chaperone
VKLAIKGMTCGGCASAARIALQRVEGVYQAEVSLENASAVVLYDPKKTSPEALIGQLKKFTGFEARVISDNGGPGRSQKRST